MNNFNCWFCNQPTEVDNNYLTGNCNSCVVSYHFVSGTILYMVEFKTTISFNEKVKEFHIIYFNNDKKLIVEEHRQLPDSFGSFNVRDISNVFSVKYESPVLTPQNVATKLPTLILFS